MAFRSLEAGICKMPAADPEVHLAAKELVRDPEAYFASRRESDLRQVQEIMRRRSDKLVKELAEQARQQRRERLRQLLGKFSWRR